MKPLSYLLSLTVFLAALPIQAQYIDPTGTYVLEGDTGKDDEIYGYFGEIQVKRLTDTKIVLTFMISKGAPSYNSGSFVDTLHYRSNQAVYTVPEIDPGCCVTFDFTDKGVAVDQETDNYNLGCGFGHAVVARDFFSKTSSDKPILRYPMTQELIEEEE